MARRRSRMRRLTIYVPEPLYNDLRKIVESGHARNLSELGRNLLAASLYGWRNGYHLTISNGSFGYHFRIGGGGGKNLVGDGEHHETVKRELLAKFRELGLLKK